jgi:quercetin dioxygenase-like cupin family protein
MDRRFFLDAELPLETLEPGRVARKLRARGGRLMMVEVLFEQGAEGAEHRHPHQQVTYCLAGTFRFTLEGRAETLRPGDSLYIPADAPHGTVCLEAGRLLDIFTPQREDFLKS